MDTWKIIFSIYLGICILPVFVECELIANGTFTVTYKTPLGDGIWQASASCDTSFPYKTYGPNEAWMFTRFGVPIINYMDYLGGNLVEIGLNKAWVLSRVGYGSSGYSLIYNLQFDYDVWLGPGVPSGDCFQFTKEQEARDFAASAPSLSDPPADTLVTSTDLQIASIGHTGAQGLCSLQFPGISFGQRESVILVNFTVPVTYQNDFIGNMVLHVADDKTWYIVRNTYANEQSLHYYFNFAFETTSTDISSATCALYVSEEDALSAASPPPTSMPFSTGGVSASVLATLIGSTVTVSPVPVTTASSNPATSAGVIVLSHLVRPSQPSGKLIENQDMRNKYVFGNYLWKKSASVLACARLCLADDSCISIFHNEASSECTAHKVVYGSGQAVQGVSYFSVSP